MDIRAILHHIQQGASDRQTAAALKVNRRTVQQYRRWAVEQGLLDGPLPPPEQLQAHINQTLPAKLPPQNQSSVAPYQEQIIKLYQQGVEIAAIWARLQEQGYTGGYHPVYRLVRKLAPRSPEVYVRVECKPGEEAQVDFGAVGYLLYPTTTPAPPKPALDPAACPVRPCGQRGRETMGAGKQGPPVASAT